MKIFTGLAGNDTVSREPSSARTDRIHEKTCLRSGARIYPRRDVIRQQNNPTANKKVPPQNENDFCGCVLKRLRICFRSRYQ